MTKNKRFFLVKAELLNQWKQAPHGINLARHERIATSAPINSLNLTVQVDSEVVSWFEQEITDLQCFSDTNTRLWTGSAEVSHFQGIEIDVSTMVTNFPSSSIATQCGNFTPFAFGIYQLSPLFANTNLTQKMGVSCSPYQNQSKRPWKLLPQTTQWFQWWSIVSGITGVRRHLAKNWLFNSLALQRIISMLHTLTSKDKISRGEEIHEMKERLIDKIQLHDALDMYWWMCDSHVGVHGTLRVSQQTWNTL